MNADKAVRELRAVEEKYRGRFTPTFEVSISEMAHDCANVIESLQAQLATAQERERAAVALIPRECGTCEHWDKSNGKPYTCKLGGCARFGSPEQWQWRGPAGEGAGE